MQIENTIKRYDFYRLNGVDIILILLVVLLSLGSFLFTDMGLDWRFTRKTEGFIYNNGISLKTLDLEKDAIIPLLNGKMTIETRGGKIRVVKSDCPQQICLHTGWISKPGQIIACVPNKILIEIDSPHASIVNAVVP